ncbi:hypothetical protein [Ornithinibacillus halotolerans]|uniref:Uncharacterized protein n=1 Tax=Ornithinibacillus halotolerans TaxID=1274357 RepID=A0A916RVD4_9BACI|nr:hypothetical protein [Ornithinibacillus halotolerans]GGA71725.1 hypothetical protein GCM10008025_14500 [Ornithinibacillus halotolerans]
MNKNKKLNGYATTIGLLVGTGLGIITGMFTEQLLLGITIGAFIGYGIGLVFMVIGYKK